LAHYCFVASYTYSLLRDGYGFDLDRNITVVSKVNGLKVGWALGAMLYEINALPWEYVPPSTWVNAFIGSFLLNILFFFLVIFFLRKSHESAAAIMSVPRRLPSPGPLPVFPTDPRSCLIRLCVSLVSQTTQAGPIDAHHLLPSCPRPRQLLLDPPQFEPPLHCAGRAQRSCNA
jgi:hypothetical protein